MRKQARFKLLSVMAASKGGVLPCWWKSLSFFFLPVSRCPQSEAKPTTNQIQAAFLILFKATHAGLCSECHTGDPKICEGMTWMKEKWNRCWGGKYSNYCKNRGQVVLCFTSYFSNCEPPKPVINVPATLAGPTYWLFNWRTLVTVFSCSHPLFGVHVP